MAEMQQLPPQEQQAPAPQAPELNQEVPVAENTAGIRNFRPRRYVYSEEDRERAIKMLDNGVSCRQVAKSLGPRCSSGTPIRWRKLKLKQDEARRLMEVMLRRPGNALAR